MTKKDKKATNIFNSHKIISREIKNEESTTSEIDLSTASYIPLPPSPSSWELRQDKDQDFYDVYTTKENIKILDAYWEKKFNSVVSLIDTISPDKHIGKIGDTFLKSYKKLIYRWTNKEKPLMALKWSSLMMEKLPKLVSDTDRKRHNKLIDSLDSKGISHSHKKYEILQTPQNKESLFMISDWCNWSVLTEEKLPMTERPDPAFKDVFPMFDGSLFLDRKGRSKIVSEGTAAVQKRNRSGKISVETTLSHDVYRIGINPLGEGFAVLSSSCGFYVYGPDMNNLFSKDLKNLGEEKNYIRCVDTSLDMNKFLYTVIDQAWCIDKNGNQIWAKQMPLLPGWEKVVERAENFGTSQEVYNALSLFGLDFPYEIENLKKKYRELAKIWHPDLHPNDSTMHERMQKLNNAFEILTGAEPPSIIDMESETVYYKKVIDRTKIKIPGEGSIEIEFSIGGSGRDWIYAACFDSNGKYTYLGAYSGRIIQLDNAGNALRIFDVGSVPERMVIKGEYIYILTATRLYILRNDVLCKIVDVFEKGKLIMAYPGFGFVESKAFRWFSEEGELIGEIHTKDPIRQVYSTRKELMVETRQHRAKIAGSPIWWPENQY